MYQVVIAMVPEGPGLSPDALDGLRGQDLFKLVSTDGLRMSFEGPGGGISPTFVRSHRTRWVLRDDVTRSSLGELVIGIMNRPGASTPLALMSDSWISFAHESNPGGQEIIVSKGAIEGRVSMRQSGTVLLGSINGGPEQVLVRDVPLSSTGSFLFEIVMPLNRARGVTNRLANELVPEYAGSWTVTANPPLGQNLPAGTEPEGRTPFQFDLVGLHLTVDSAVYLSDEVIPKTETEPEKRWSRGGTYQVTSRILGNQDFAGVFGAKTLGWKAEVISPSNEVIRTLYGLTPQGGFPVEWDGKTSSGQSAPGGIRYGIRMSALVRDNVDPTDPAENSGGHLKTSSLAEGPADADLPAFGELQVTPNPYIVYEYRFDDEGYAIWPDDTGDGIPDRFPDDDGDGVPDYEAGTVVPIEIYAPLNRKGYDTTWSVEVFAEDGTTRLHEPWTGVGDVSVTWEDPPQDLEPQELEVKLISTTCWSAVELEVRAQNDPVRICGDPLRRTRSLRIGSAISMTVESDPEFNPDDPFAGVLSNGLIGASDPSADLLGDILRNVSRDRRLRITVKGVKRSVSSIPCILTNESGSTKTVQLQRSADGSSLEVQTELSQSLLDSKADFCAIDDAFDGKIGALFSTLMTGLPSSTNFPKPRVFRGRTIGADETVDSTIVRRQMLQDNLALTSVGTLKSCGFEKWRATVNVTGPNGEAVEVKADFKVQNVASALLVNCANKGEKLLVESTFLSPLSMALSGVHTAIVGGGDALRIRNYDVPRHALSDADDVPWGAIWNAKRGDSGSVFMGYRNQAPSDEDFEQVLQEYFSLLASFEARGVANSRRKAWLMSNYALREARNACVLDAGGYHYIHGGWEYDKDGRYRYNPKVWQIAFVSIRSADWRRQRPSGIAVPVFAAGHSKAEEGFR
jgi:hypothetical protein